MKTFSTNIERVTSIITKLLLLITPLFFFPVTREFVLISKMYFFIYVVIILMIMALGYIIATKKVIWTKDVMINGLFLFIVANALSIVIMAPNKVQSLFLPYFGFVALLSLVIYYLFLLNAARENSRSILYYTGIAGFIASIVSIFFFVQPFRAVELPATFSFLQSPLFNTVGSQIDFIVFIGFAILSLVLYFVHHKKNHEGKAKGKSQIFFYVFLTTVIIAGTIQAYEVVRSVFVNGNNLLLPPFGTSWIASIDILKNPMTALFGVGVGNFAAIFTQVKDPGYNLTDLWQISSFNVSRSVFFHILTETGIVGMVGIGFVLYNISRFAKKVDRSAFLLMMYMLAVMLFFPPSFMIFFMFIVALAYFSLHIPKTEEGAYVVNLGMIMPVFISSVLLFLVFIVGLTYFTSTAFASEVIFKNSLDAIARNDIRGLYDMQRNAIIVNPYNEEFRKSFSQTNLIIANNIASKKPEEITDEDRETIAQVIQASIEEAKAAVTLNPQKVSNWQYLASIYRNIINVADGADLWTIAAYQRAILLDPQNPVYRLELGGVYYLLESYDDAQRLFEQAVTLKPDWANAHYNLAWAYYRQEQYQAAIAQMEQVLALTDRETNKADYDQATKDLAEFRKNAPQQAADGETEATESADLNETSSELQEDLGLPTPPVATVEPRIELPQDASPEAGLGTIQPIR